MVGVTGNDERTREAKWCYPHFTWRMATTSSLESIEVPARSPWRLLPVKLKETDVLLRCTDPRAGGLYEWETQAGPDTALSVCPHSGYLALPGPSKTLSLYQARTFSCERLPGAPGEVAGPGCQDSYCTPPDRTAQTCLVCVPLGTSSPFPDFLFLFTYFVCLFLFLLLFLERGDGSIEINTDHPNGNAHTLSVFLSFSLSSSPRSFSHVLTFTHNVYYHFFEQTRLDHSL